PLINTVNWSDLSEHLLQNSPTCDTTKVVRGRPISKIKVALKIKISLLEYSRKQRLD
nr:hypothetical protein [Tanacetum cinerariifolium]